MRGTIHKGSAIPNGTASLKEKSMNRRLLTAGIAALAVTATPLLASSAMAKPTKSHHHVKKETKKTTTTTSTSTSTTPASATPAKKPMAPAKK